MITELLKETEGRMVKTLQALKDELRTIRTGRASPALLERVMVEYYGIQTPLNQLAVISAPEPQLLTVRPYDPSSLADIERGIRKSDVGLTPTNDGKIIRLAVPSLTEERREELVKVVNRRVEEAKVALRNIRRESLDDLREFESEGMISKDEFYRAKDDLQDLIDRYSDEVEKSGERKSKEIMEV